MPDAGSRFDGVERILMASIIRQAVRDYLPQGPYRFHKDRRVQSRHKTDARDWLFDDSETSSEYVFGFHFICGYLGFSIERLRKSIREMEASGRSRLYSRSAFHIGYPVNRKSREIQIGGPEWTSI